MKIGSLFSGVAGLDRAVEAVTGATPAWFVEFDKAPSKVLARQFPDVPNYGDVTSVDWLAVEPIDILTGGFPCQDLSHAGKRAGLRPGTRSGLWEHMAYAIEQLQPRLVVIENVRGLLSAQAHSDVEPCPWCMGDGSDGYMRALGAVLADLADLGYDAQWLGIRASDVGAPHGRFRVFIVGYPAGNADGKHTGDYLPGPRQRISERSSLPPAPDPDGRQFSRATVSANRLSEPRKCALVPTPLATGDSTSGHPNYLPLGDAVRELLPTPTPFTNANTETPEEWVDRRADVVERTGTHHGLPLSVAAVSIAAGEPLLQSNPTASPQHHPDVWGPYAPAIRTWESILGEKAPLPTMQDANGRHRLNPELPRWMMGFPPGWLDGLTPAQQLKAAGNAVCQQQAEAALRIMLGLA